MRCLLKLLSFATVAGKQMYTNGRGCVPIQPSLQKGKEGEWSLGCSLPIPGLRNYK